MKPETCYYDVDLQRMEGHRTNKIRQFLRDDLISPDNQVGVYVVRPAPGRRQVNKVDILRETCTCQHFTQKGLECSHIIAVKMYLNQVDSGARRMT